MPTCAAGSQCGFRYRRSPDTFVSSAQSLLCHHSAELSWFQSYLSNRRQTFHFTRRQSLAFPVDCSILQGSVLRPLSFAPYTDNVVDLLDRHKVQSHLHADDTQLYASCRPDDVDILTRLSHCSADVAQWCASRRLQLSADKTKVILVGFAREYKGTA